MKPLNLFCLIAIALLFSSGCRLNFSDGYSFDYSGIQVNKSINTPISANIKELRIENKFGNVQVVHDANATAEWDWDATIWADDAESADSFLSQLEMVASLEDDVLSLVIVMPVRSSSLNGVQSNLIINVPQSVQVTSTNSHGDTLFAGLEGDSQLTNSHGDVSVQNVVSINIDSAHGDVTLTNSLGAATISNAHGRVNVANTKNVFVDGRHSNIKLNNAMGDVQVETTHGDIKITNVRGSLIVNNQHGDIDANNIDGKINAATTHADILVRGQSESLQISNRHGEIDAELWNSDFKSIQLDTTHDDIILTIPAESKINLDMDEDDSSSELDSTQDGVPVKLGTTHGSIRVKVAK